MVEIKDQTGKAQHTGNKSRHISDETLDIWIHGLECKKSKTLYEEKKLKKFQDMKIKRQHQVADEEQLIKHERNTAKPRKSMSFINMFDTTKNYDFKKELESNERNDKSQSKSETSNTKIIETSNGYNEQKSFPLIESDLEESLEMESVLKMLYSSEVLESGEQNLSKRRDNISEECEIKNEKHVLEIKNENRYELVDSQKANQSQHKKVKTESLSFDSDRQEMLRYEDIKKESSYEVFQFQEEVIPEEIKKETIIRNKSSKGGKKEYKIFNNGQSSEYHCDICTYKTNTRNKITIHVRRTHNTNLYPCNQCDYKAKYSHNLKDHIKIKHEQSGVKQFSCDHCNLEFTRKDNLKIHKEAQHNGINYTCEKCGFIAKRRDTLRQHTEVQHEGFRYTCEQCDFITTYKKLLKEHTNFEHDGIQYTCEQCPYTTKLKKSLKFHVESKHEGIKYFCEQCGHSASSTRQLGHHVKLVHEGIKYWKKWEVARNSSHLQQFLDRN